MPVIYSAEIGRSALIMWQITETEAQLRELVGDDDLRSAGRFASEKRRVQHLAWRAALRTLVPHGAVEYTAEGCPYIENPATDLEAHHTIYLSATHTDGMAAVVVGTEPCGVDVESLGRDFSRTAPRFISPAEAMLNGSERAEFPAAVWCAKEALYKCSGRRELDFLRDIEVTAFEVADLAAADLEVTPFEAADLSTTDLAVADADAGGGADAGAGGGCDVPVTVEARGAMRGRLCECRDLPLEFVVVNGYIAVWIGV